MAFNLRHRFLHILFCFGINILEFENKLQFQRRSFEKYMPKIIPLLAMIFNTETLWCTMEALGRACVCGCVRAHSRAFVYFLEDYVLEFKSDISKNDLFVKFWIRCHLSY